MPLPFLTAAAEAPSFRHRGLYVEGSWGSDLMTLDDWRELIDEMAGLRLNSLGIGIYGCWPGPEVGSVGGTGDQGVRNEVLMVPFPGRPALRTPRTIRWYSPAAREHRELTYLPRMFEQDFFGQVVAYGVDRGVMVRPHFNGPGHSTLIPRVYPEVSARDERGEPVGYGYCLSSERTYDLLFSLYDSLIERYLRPHGATWWHLGLDEIDPSAGIDEADPARVVDPWCGCARCAARPRAQLLVDFAVRCAQHLVEQGIEQITVWHDALAKLGAFPALKEALTSRELTDRVAVQWWRYVDPPLAVGERSLRSWVTPMAGYWPERMHQEYGTNVWGMAAEGAAAGSEGIDAYCLYDPASFRNYAAVAAVGLDPSLDLPAFSARFAAWLFEGQHVPAAFHKFDMLFDASDGPLGSILDALLPPGSAAEGQATPRRPRYPRDVIAQLAADPLRIGQSVEAAQRDATALSEACASGAEHALDDRRRRLLAEYACEAEKLAGVVSAFRLAARGWNHYRRAQAFATHAETLAALTRAQAAFQAAGQAVAQTMSRLERQKQPYLQPLVLRALTPLYEWCFETHDRVRSYRTEVEAGGRDELPSL